MWDQLVAAFCLALILEGALPFLSPTALRQAMESFLQMSDGVIRLAGFCSMVVGCLLLYVVR